jgi:heme/copper-type cytochrome/quinol oxidase subunit 4
MISVAAALFWTRGEDGEHRQGCVIVGVTMVLSLILSVLARKAGLWSGKHFSVSAMVIMVVVCCPALITTCMVMSRHVEKRRRAWRVLALSLVGVPVVTLILGWLAERLFLSP